MRRIARLTCTIAPALLGGGLAACGGGATPATGPAPESVTVRLLDARGVEVGIASLTAEGAGVRFHVEVADLAPGGHGFRIASTGRCDGPDFTTAGAVLDPGGETVQAADRVGHVAGALPDVPVGDDGKGSANFVDDLVTLDTGPADSLRGPRGSALVVTANPGDLTTRSTSTGARVACGVISPETASTPTPSPSPSPTPTVRTSTTTVTVTRSVTPTPAPPTHTAAAPTPTPTPTPTAGGVPTP
jgi:superoxide dismutase, Cu-Zn family